MRKVQSIALVTCLGLSLAIAPTAQAKAKITKPSAPTISAVSSSAVKKGKVNVTVTIALPTSDGGSNLSGSKVTAGGKSCTIKKTKTSCTLKSIKTGKALNISAKSKNKKGYGPASTSVAYTAGASAWPGTPVASVVPATTTPDPVATTPAPVVALTCATGGTCVVGETGPGGGIVYYVDVAGFNCGSGFTATGSPTRGKCKYLEVAPSGWSTKTEAYAWAESANGSSNITDIVDLGSIGALNVDSQIGLGYKNSILIVAQGNGTMTAAGDARSYTGGSKVDWYLPTGAELNLLCQWNRGVIQPVTTQCEGGTLNSDVFGAGPSGFVATFYWSSTEFDERTVWLQALGDGSQGAEDKMRRRDIFGKLSGGAAVRPIRAF